MIAAAVVPNVFELVQRVIQAVQSGWDVSFWASIPAALIPAVIFTLRAADQTLSTLRMLFVTQGARAASWVLGAFQALFFVSAVAGVLGQLTNPLNLIAYALGYGAGSALGITLEGWLAPGHATLRVVSSGRGPALVEGLRQAGWGVTEIPGQGLQGTVSVLICSVPRRQVTAARQHLLLIDPQAFITVEHVRPLQGGWNP